jgi:DNA-binding CsgD family transcriptional regulator
VLLIVRDAEVEVNERRIAELASGGITNREIAQPLFITAPDG